MKKVIVDCDSGNDDAWAIISLIRAEEKCNYKVLAITCVDGNTGVEHSSLNNLLILKSLDRLDLPVYIGCTSSLIKKNTDIARFHGLDGFGETYNEKPSKDLIQKKHAVLAIRDYIEQNPSEITLIAVGPLTNIAMLYKLYPGISKSVKGLYIMGGNRMGVGNITACAEFNFWHDPEAAHIVFAESECPIYVFPWEPCIEASLSMPFNDWRIRELASTKSAFTTLLDPIEIKAYTGVLPFWTPCDCFLAACFILPKLIEKMENYNVTIELAGNHTRGQMIIDDRQKENANAFTNAFIIEKINVELFKKFMMWVCHHDVDDLPF